MSLTIMYLRDAKSILLAVMLYIVGNFNQFEIMPSDPDPDEYDPDAEVNRIIAEEKKAHLKGRDPLFHRVPVLYLLASDNEKLRLLINTLYGDLSNGSTLLFLANALQNPHGDEFNQLMNELNFLDRFMPAYEALYFTGDTLDEAPVEYQDITKDDEPKPETEKEVTPEQGDKEEAASGKDAMKSLGKELAKDKKKK